MIRIDQVTKTLGRRRVLDGLTLDVPHGEALGLIGRSGAGKTTLLRIVAGLDQPDAGRVWLEGRDMTTAEPHGRRVGLVFQDLALWPHLTALQHLLLVAEPLRLARGERRRRAFAWLERLQIGGAAARRPDQISGGERQRLALSRALLPEPRILLLDEPFTGCDPPLVAELQRLVDGLRRDLGLTVMLVSHDWRHLEGLAGRVALLDGGRIVIDAAPEEVRRAVQGTPLASFVPPA